MKVPFLFPIVLVAVLLVSSGLAQSFPRFACTTKTPQTDRELNEWIRSDVLWITTDAETELFAKLESVLERQEFIKGFWERRDPNPSTPENEFRDSYCARLSQTERFQSGIPGWKTDRGRILVLWGSPDSIRRGRTEVDGNQGVPFERWSYKHIEGLGSDIVVTFVDPTESNEYRFSTEDLKWLSEYFRNSAKGLTTSVGPPRF